MPNQKRAVLGATCERPLMRQLCCFMCFVCATGTFFKISPRVPQKKKPHSLCVWTDLRDSIYFLSAKYIKYSSVSFCPQCAFLMKSQNLLTLLNV